MRTPLRRLVNQSQAIGEAAYNESPDCTKGNAKQTKENFKFHVLPVPADTSPLPCEVPRPILREPEN